MKLREELVWGLLCLPAVAAPMAQWPGLFSSAESVLPAASSGEILQSVCLRRHRGAIPRVVECIACIVGCGQRGSKREAMKVQWHRGFVPVAAKVAVVCHGRKWWQVCKAAAHHSGDARRKMKGGAPLVSTQQVSGSGPQAMHAPRRVLGWCSPRNFAEF